MDPRDRADALLARARARGRFIVTPDNMTSPMDASDTQQIPRALVNALDPHLDPDSTMILPADQMQTSQLPVQTSQPEAKESQQRPATAQAPAAPSPEVTQTIVAPGVVPTVQHHNISRPSLSQRLNGDTGTKSSLSRRLNGDG